MKNPIVSLIFVVVMLGVGFTGYYWLTHREQQNNSNTTQNFSVDGNVVRNNPGLTPGIWYLVYERPGAAALTAELNFDRVVEPQLVQGDRVHVEGDLKNSRVSVSRITKLENEMGTNVKLYYYNPNNDQGPGGAQCSRNGLVAVDRVIPKTNTPLKDTITLLLRGELSQEEIDRGITTEYPLPGVTLQGAVIQNGVATLTFTDPQDRTSGGSCRVGILWFQIEQTAKQFPNIETVKFLPETLFQP